MNPTNAGCDLLCICPHTDDAEIALGGTLALLARAGRKVWVCDLTRGELGSNGTPEERWREAAEASAHLGLTGRLQFELPDGFVDVGAPEQVATVAAVIRRLRPRWIATAPMPNRHPDHRAIGALVEKAAFMSRLAAWSPDLPAHRIWDGGALLPDPTDRWQTEAVLHVCLEGEQADVLFDVSSVWDKKLAALKAYATQFEAVGERRPTMINDPAFLEQVERWARARGFRAGVSHAEALRTSAAPLLSDLPRERWT